jgi:TPR repeat protein
MKKTIFAILMATSFSALSSDRLEIPTTNYFPDRSEIAAQLNVDIKALGGFNRIESMVGSKDATANYIIGQMNRLGMGYQQDAKAAYDYFSVAAENGHDKAYYYLAMLVLDKDPIINVDLDMSRSEKLKMGYELIRKSAEKGFPQAQYLLADLYIKGEYFTKDINMALFWLTRSAQAGHSLASQQRRIILSNKVELKKSYDKIRKRVINGNREAMVELAKLYIEGYVVPQNYKKAYDILLTASRLGSRQAGSIIIQLEDSYAKEIK